jgi:sulfate permease, SulP family
MPPFRSPQLRDDATGGLMSALIAVPLAMAFGMFAFVALGDQYFAYGAMAGLYAAMIVGITSVAFGDRSTTVYAPRITTTFVLGGLLYHLVHSDAELMRRGNHDLILLAFYAIILLAGLFQALFGAMRLGSLLRFTPQPVMAGFQNAAAALLFLVQLGNVSGFEQTVAFTRIVSHWHEIKPLSVVVAGVTFISMWKARAVVPRTPPLLVGLGVGTAVYFCLVALGLSAHLGPVIGLGDISPGVLSHFSYLPQPADVLPLLPTIIGGSLALAIVAALDTLLCAKLVTPPTAKTPNGDHLLIRLGLGNVVAAGAGGITSGINIGASVTNRAFGAKTPISVLINAIVLLAVILAAFPVLSYLPRAVLSAAVMVIAIQHIDPWSIELVRRIRTRAARHRSLMLLDLVMVLAVALLAVSMHIVLAVFLGIVIAVALFVVRMSRSNIRRAYRCDTIHSRRARTPDEMAALESSGAEILVLELQGPLFFGTAELLKREIEARAANGTRAVVLDIRRVTEIDATGVQILDEIAGGLARNGQLFLLALAAKSETGARLHETGVLDAIGPDRMFEDVDRAIERAEDELLRGSTAPRADAEIPLAQIDLLRGLTPDEIKAVAARLRRVAYRTGDQIFRQGDPGEDVFIVMKGRASAYLDQIDGGRIRLATFAPGTAFGELAILDAGPRSATLVADEDIVCCALRVADFEDLARNTPAIAIKLLTGLGRELSGRLRRANQTIHQLES